MRLNLFISKSGLTSRRKADLLIKEGKVEVNGKKVLEPYFQVSDNDEVKVAGKLAELKRYTYLVLNKPKGVVTTREDKFAKKKIIDLLPEKFKSLYPVGRLDKDSSGLIILTNDGDLCYRLTHPSFLVEKEYLVKLRGVLTRNDCQKLKQGVDTEGDYLKVDAIEIVRKQKNESLCRVVVHEGKKRHLRRLFTALGFEILDLKRIRIGKLSLGRLVAAKFKELSKDKMYALITT